MRPGVITEEKMLHSIAEEIMASSEDVG